MKTSWIALALSPVLAVGAANAQVAPDPDPDLLNAKERALGKQPWANPGWTWMKESHALQILKASGFDVVIGLEKSGEAWRGKAMEADDSYHVAVNRYAEVYGHFDQKTLARHEFHQKATREREELIATLNGSVAAPSYQVAKNAVVVGRPAQTMMGERCWTWMREDQAQKILESKGYADIKLLKRGDHGNWEAIAIKDHIALRVNLDWYGNTQHQPEGLGGFAQADPVPNVAGRY
jgi:hypothetical protein